MASWLVISTLDEIMPNSLKFCILELHAKSLLTPSQTRLIPGMLPGQETLEMEFSIEFLPIFILCVFFCNQAKNFP